MTHPDGIKRTALVTGANRGLGFAITCGLAELGHTVYRSSRDPKAGEAAAGALRSLGLEVTEI
jgi:NAD(P)-dependent dehydrogenase (short-subunit alcohol dehydrogenase family)